MPLYNLVDERGHFYQWGQGKRYYYDPTNKRSQVRAKNKALMQAKAIEASKQRNLKKL